MPSNLEWGLCLLIAYMFYYGYRGRGNILKSIRVIWKKCKGIMPVNQNNSIGHYGAYSQSEIGPDIIAPASPRSQRNFSSRRKNISSPTYGVSKEQLQFYRKTNSQTQNLDLFESNPITNPCAACNYDDDGVNPTREASSSGIKNCFEIETNDPRNPWYIRLFASVVFFWRKSFLGDQNRLVELKNMMTYSRVKKAIETCARQKFEENPEAGSLESEMRKHRERAEQIIIKMRAKQAKNPFFRIYFRVAGWFIGKTLGLIYHKIFIDQNQIESIFKIKSLGYPIIYLPLHRSHMDYVLVTWTLLYSNMCPPAVAGGENLDFPICSLILKSIGSFFIKRKLDRKEGEKDHLYRAILQSYTEMTLINRYDMEIFIEGGRTRSGKPGYPKCGLLSFAVDALIHQKVEDIIIVPVNFSYEKLLEGNYVREQLGGLKTKENLASAAFGLWNSLRAKLGNARVDYGKPFLVREFIQLYQNWKFASLPSRSINYYNSSDQNRDQSQKWVKNPSAELKIGQRELVSRLASHVVYNGFKYLSVMSTSALAFLLLNKWRGGISLKKLIVEIAHLREELIKRNHAVIFDGDLKDVVDNGLDLLGPTLVKREFLNQDDSLEVTLKPVTEVPFVIELSYYSTSVLPIYALESVIATSILSLTNKDIQWNHSDTDSSDIVILEAELIATCLELCGILHHEFIFHPPCQTLLETIRKSMRFMQSDGLLRLQSPNESELEDSESELSSNYHNLVYISNTPESKSRLLYLKNLVKPILDTYSVSCFALKRLITCEAQEKQLQMDMLAEVKSQLQQNFIHCGESLTIDPIRNLIKLLVDWQVLEVLRKDSVSIYYLQAHFDNAKSLDEVIHRVARLNF